MITKKEKVAVYEELMHKIQAMRCVSMEHGRVVQLLDLICAWSYAHRSGDPMTDKQRRRRVNDAFRRIKKNLNGGE